MTAAKRTHAVRNGAAISSLPTTAKQQKDKHIVVAKMPSSQLFEFTSAKMPRDEDAAGRKGDEGLKPPWKDKLGQL